MSVPRGSTRTPAGSVCPPRIARASLQAPPTPAVQSSIPAVGAGEPPPHPQTLVAQLFSSLRGGGGQGPLLTHCGQGPAGVRVPGSTQSPDTAHLSHSTCSGGTWACQQSSHCPSTCTLYGEGHVVTFDGQRFVFDGNCEYILATVSAGLGMGCGAQGQ